MSIFDPGEEQLSKAIQDADAWMLKYGIVAPYKHNAVVVDLRVVFPQILDLEYFLDNANRRVDLVLYLSTFRLILYWITFSTGRFLDKVLKRVEVHFEGYAVRITLKQIKKLKERTNEIANNLDDFVVEPRLTSNLLSEAESAQQPFNN